MLFKASFDASKNNTVSMIFFNKLALCENTTTIVAYADDVNSNIVFLYRDEEGLKYYISDEIKKIIVKELQNTPNKINH